MKQMKGWMAEELGLHTGCLVENLFAFLPGEIVISSAVGRENKLYQN